MRDPATGELVLDPDAGERLRNGSGQDARGLSFFLSGLAGSPSRWRKPESTGRTRLDSGLRRNDGKTNHLTGNAARRRGCYLTGPRRRSILPAAKRWRAVLPVAWWRPGGLRSRCRSSGVAFTPDSDGMHSFAAAAPGVVPAIPVDHSLRRRYFAQ